MPGAQGERIKTTSSKASRSGQKGLIAALAICPDGSGLYVAGSYAGSVIVYDKAHKRVCALQGVEGRGVTQVGHTFEPPPIRAWVATLTTRSSWLTLRQIEFHPLSPHIVYVASRRSPHLVQAFSLLAPRRPLANFPRSATAGSPSPRGSNQRGRFSLDRWGRYLVAGDEAGRVGFYDVLADSDVDDGVEPRPKGEPIPERWPGYVLQAGQGPSTEGLGLRTVELLLFSD